MDSRREETILKLEKAFGRRVLAIVYNPEYENGIAKGDEYNLLRVLIREKGDEGMDRCMIVLSGSGGNFGTALLMSYILRKHFNYYSCFVPTVAGSALCYLILHGNKLIMGDKSLLTQIDPLFEYEGDTYRALKHLDDKNPEITGLAHNGVNPIWLTLRKRI